MPGFVDKVTYEGCEKVISFLHSVINCPHAMPKQLLIRDIPAELDAWLGEELNRTKMSQREFIISLLEKHARQKKRLSERRHVDDGDAAFTFIDLFAGIGGFRIAMERYGGKCLYTSEWDKFAQKTYSAWFGELPEGDIRKVKPSDIPDHNILVAGFPCQPFSIAGVSKKISLGRKHGFKDKDQGNLFFVLADIIREKRPPVVLLENVKNLTRHDKGRTWQVINNTLDKELNYKVYHEIFDAAYWVPQHRERVFIVGFDREIFGDDPGFKFGSLPKMKKKFRNILEQNPENRYTLTPKLWQYLQDYAKKHREKGNGFGFGMADLDGVTRTLSARYHKDGSEILISQGPKKTPRRLTPRECARLMGFPEDKEIVVSDTQAYRQFGNAVAVPVVEHVIKSILPMLVTAKYKSKKKAVKSKVKEEATV